MNQFIVTMPDSTKVLVPTEMSMKDFVQDLIGKKIEFKLVSEVKSSGNSKYERRSFATFDEAKVFATTLTNAKKGIDHKGGQFTVWYDPQR